MHKVDYMHIGSLTVCIGHILIIKPFHSIQTDGLLTNMSNTLGIMLTVLLESIQ